MNNKDYTQKVQSVRVEGLALLKIIRHAQECAAQDIQGHGLNVGFTINNVLEITNSFPFPHYSDEDPNVDLYVKNYNLEMRQKLGEVMCDYYSAGIYQIVLAGSFLNRSNLENLFQYQKTYPDNIMLIYDPSLTMHGQIGLQAYRLAPDVYQDMLENDQKTRFGTSTKSSFDGLWECEAAANGRANFMRLFEEIPVTINNSHLSNLILHDIVDPSSKIPRPGLHDFTNSPSLSQDTLHSISPELSNIGSLEQQLKSLLLGLEKIHDLQYNYQRKLVGIGKSSTNEMRHRDLPPIKLEMALLSADMNNFCSVVSQMAGESVGKLMLTKAIQPTTKGSNKF